MAFWILTVVGLGIELLVPPRQAQEKAYHSFDNTPYSYSAPLNVLDPHDVSLCALPT